MQPRKWLASSSFGVAPENWIAQFEAGRLDCAGFFISQRLPTDMLTDSEIHSRWSCSWPAFRSSGFQSCLDIRASASRRGITHLGCDLGKNNLSWILKVRGSGIHLFFSKRRVRQRYTENLKGLTDAISNTKNGTRGGGRTHTTRKRQGILSPPRMPFRHPGPDTVKLSYQKSYCNVTTRANGFAEFSVSVVVPVALSRESNRSTAARVCFGARWEYRT